VVARVLDRIHGVFNTDRCSPLTTIAAVFTASHLGAASNWLCVRFDVATSWPVSAFPTRLGLIPGFAGSRLKRDLGTRVRDCS